ncbi:MAG TPA: phospholipase D-like domain-containing protein [Nocardioidaceae bacterium]
MGIPFLVAIVMTVVDSYRRRGKKPRPFPTDPPGDVQIGEGGVRTYTYGQHLYDDMLDAIASAQKQILFESYIWKGDEVGEQFKRALNKAAGRGVEVYAIYDGFANLVVPPRFKKFGPRLRVMEYPFYTAGWRFFDLRRYGRDHRKILVVDDRVGFVGGYNVGSAYATEWRDTHARITGPGVWDLKRAFADFWNLHRSFHNGSQPLLLETPSDWEPRIRMHRNVPRLWMFPIRAMYLEAINRASQHIYMTHAYFIPDTDFVEALMAAAQRGVDVRLLVPATSNHVVADWLSRGYYGELLAAGVRIFRYESMVHAKTSTIDGRWSTIGTANIDRLSMTGNYEINVEFIDPEMAAQMERIFATDLTNARELTADEWEGRGVHKKFTELVLAPLRPFL